MFHWNYYKPEESTPFIIVFMSSNDCPKYRMYLVALVSVLSLKAVTVKSKLNNPDNIFQIRMSYGGLLYDTFSTL
jgi:hypothetical protein